MLPSCSSKGRSENAEAVVADLFSIGVYLLLIHQRNAFLTSQADCPGKAPI